MGRNFEFKVKRNKFRAPYPCAGGIALRGSKAVPSSGSGKKGKILFQGASRFNEFVVQTSESSYEINNRLLEKKVIGGFPLKKFYPELGNAALWCCTELNTKEQIDAAVEAVGQ